MNSRARLIKAIDNSACLTRRQINDYIYKKLFPEEQYVVEMHLNECPFCNDAIEGFLKASNANQLLSEVDTLQLPAVEAIPEPLVEKVVSKKETITPAVTKTATEGPIHSSQRKTVTFEEPDRKRGMGWKVGLAAAAVLGLGVWGLNRFNNHKAEKAAMLAKANESANALDEGVTPPVSRQEDSAMNAKFGMQSAPVVASRSTTVTRESSATTDSTGAMAATADVTAAAAPPASAAMSREVATAPVVAAAKTAAPAEARAKTMTTPAEVKAKTTAAPALAKTTNAETRSKVAEVAKEADMSTSSSTTTTKPVVTAVKTTVTEKTVSKEKVRPSAKTPEERALDAATKKAAAEKKAIAQAEADFKKAMDLYKKKQYASALPYFQAVAKKPELPNSKQAAKYVKLCKEQLAKEKDDK